MAYQKVTIHGNLTRDPETRSVGSTSVTSFSVAVNESWTDKEGNKKENVVFFNCEAWGKTGEVLAKYLTKGNQILIDGKIAVDTWDDKETGQKKERFKVRVENFSFCGGGSGSAPSGNQTGTRSAPSPSAPVTNSAVDDDVPF